MSTYVFLKVLVQLIMPPTSLAVAALLWLVLRWAGLRRLATVVVGLAIVQTTVMSLAPVSTAMLVALEDQARALGADKPVACCFDAIVVLGGTIVPAAPPYSLEPHLTDASDRMWHAARLFHAGIAPKVIVSGGTFVEQEGGPATTEAEAMRRFLIALGVPADRIVSEGKSLNTIENIRNVRDIVKDGRTLIVTSGFHVPRVANLAEKGGLDFRMVGTDWQFPSAIGPWWEVWLPSASTLSWSNVALKEMLALAFDRRGESLRR
ncbi:MAG: YdcF family protein [Reyranella sp.]|nr:MAG: YdcF family protein [Reyranella sp.]